jgi:uncharacterized membrane protein
MNWLVFARALHVVSVVLWIGGVGFATSVILPSIVEAVAATRSICHPRQAAQPRDP